MDDLISRQAAMNIFAVDLAEKDRQVSYHGFCIDAAMAIGSLPSAEKTGTWKNITLWPYDITGQAVGECSLCGKQRIVDNYCSNCGARMVD